MAVTLLVLLFSHPQQIAQFFAGPSLVYLCCVECAGPIHKRHISLMGRTMTYSTYPSP